MDSLIDILDCIEHIHLLKAVIPLPGIDQSVPTRKSVLHAVLWLLPNNHVVMHGLIAVDEDEDECTSARKVGLLRAFLNPDPGHYLDYFRRKSSTYAPTHSTSSNKETSLRHDTQVVTGAN